ncbi:MAG: glycosyltransferase [Bacteroidota bacterium]|nr:glycosyltransferase [Bacteroidota bacterium]
MLEISPIVLFVYNRPWHTEQTLNALMQNELADQSVLYIYSDGPKENATEEQLIKIEEVRQVIRKKKWCKEVHIIESEKNKGLADSIISGVTEIVNQYGKVIVLEDDIITSPGFLKYMNDALNMYSDDERVGCIHAWNYDLDSTGYRDSTFFLKGADCWGWATWKRSWDFLDEDGKALMQSLVSKKQQFEFDRRGTHKYIEMLQSQINGTNDSWAIRWHASLFLANKYCLHPTKTIVKNIGLDNSGIHCGPLQIAQNPIDFIKVNKIKVRESEWFYKAFNA